jgi:predicted amidohydrolase
MNARRIGILAALLALGSLAPWGAQAAGRVVASYTVFSKDSPMDAAADGWTTWSPRKEIAPRFRVDPKAGRDAGGALVIEGNGNPAAFGVWRRQVDGVTAGTVYRFTAYYRARSVPHERHSISARLEWLDAGGKQSRPPDYVIDNGTEQGWTRIDQRVTAPEGARSVVIQLTYRWCAGGSVAWDDIQLQEDSAAPRRVVRALTVFHRPRGTKSAAESVEQFCALVEKQGPAKADLLVLPEGISVVGTGKSYADVAEAVPGPTTKRLGALASRLRCYVVAGLYERVGTVIYNTAVLVGRDGQLVGKYRKTHLPREEVDGGITPGDSYPVFDTDFGKLGLMICWDLQFPEPARALALQGAEVIALPIWGGSDILARARAMENHAFLITSSYDMKTFIVDPKGDVLAEATAERPVAAAELQLDAEIIQPWLGNMKARTWLERRSDLPVK